ncbi:hypothetical protein CE91St19_12050 [Odoribacter laneus]|nr:hypothetical protein CE91St19_12050 [Odoribacter laneus]GKI26385.1 hypothetical protein CE91St20_25220 [Odoribacter laneus]
MNYIKMKHRKIVKASEGGVFREELTVGGYLEVQMQFSGGTGFRWYATGSPESQKYLISSVVHPGHRLGEVNISRFVYMFPVYGNFILHFELKQEWEKSPPKRRVQVYVKVV